MYFVCLSLWDIDVFCFVSLCRISMYFLLFTFM